VEASFSPGRDVIGSRQFKTTGERLREKVVVGQFAGANNGILGGDCAVLDTAETENNWELKKEAEERTLRRMAKVHNVLQMWQGRQNLHATQKESRTRHNAMTVVGYIFDTEEIIKASWSNFQPDGAAAFTLSERSPLPPAVSAKDLPGGQMPVLNVCQIRRIDGHPAESDDDSASDSISDTENCLHWNGYLDNPNQSEDKCEADDEYDIEPCSGITALGNPEHRFVSVAPNVPGLIWPTQNSVKQAEKELVTVSAMETRRNKGTKRK